MSLFDGIIACWDAGGKRSYPGTGDTWYDVVGGVNGTLENEDDDALNFNSSKGGYFEFDGTDGRVDCGDNLMVGWSEISVCVWALVENSGDDFPRLATRGGACFEFAISRSDQNRLFCYINGSYVNAPDDSMNDHYGKWTHYAMRWVTGSGNWRLYINGEVIVTSGQYDSAMGSANHDLFLAGRPTTQALNGGMGPVYIYNRALSDAEIKQLYYMQKSRFED